MIPCPSRPTKDRVNSACATAVGGAGTAPLEMSADRPCTIDQQPSEQLVSWGDAAGIQLYAAYDAADQRRRRRLLRFSI